MLVFNEERNQWIKPHIEELLRDCARIIEPL